MIRFQALGISFSLPLLTLLAPLLASRLGMNFGLFPLTISLSLHELAHILAARVMGVGIQEIRILPFGGSARMENPYTLRPHQLFIVAAAGPAANLLCAVFFAALAHWKLLSPQSASDLVQPNLVLFLFNLLPALPLDGGRMLYSLLQQILKPKKALSLCLLLSKIHAAAFLFLATAGFLRSGVLNLSLLFAAIFLLASMHDEKSACLESSLEKFTPYSRQTLPAQFFQMDIDATALAALRLMRPRAASWFLLMDEKKPAGLLSGSAVMEYLRNGGLLDVQLGRLPYLYFNAQD